MYGVSPSNNRYRKRNRETAAEGEMEVENREIIERIYTGGETKKTGDIAGVEGGWQLAFDGEACLFNERVSPLHTYPQITASH